MNKKLLVIGLIWPEPNSTAAGTRLIQLIDLFLKASYSITFSSAASKTDYSFDFGKMNIQSVEIELNNSSFDEFLMKLNPDIVLFDRFLTEEQFGWRVRESCPNALRILDTEDLHFLRKAREVCFKKNIPLTDDILKKPCHPYTIGLLKCVPRLNVKGRLDTIPGMQRIRFEDRGCDFSSRCKEKHSDCTDVVPELKEIGQGHKVACRYI